MPVLANRRNAHRVGGCARASKFRFGSPRGPRTGGDNSGSPHRRSEFLPHPDGGWVDCSKVDYNGVALFTSKPSSFTPDRSKSPWADQIHERTPLES